MHIVLTILIYIALFLLAIIAIIACNILVFRWLLENEIFFMSTAKVLAPTEIYLDGEVTQDLTDSETMTEAKDAKVTLLNVQVKTKDGLTLRGYHLQYSANNLTTPA